MKKVLVVLPVNEHHKEKLEQAGAGCEFQYLPWEEVTAEEVKAADYIIGNVPAGYIEQSSRLEVLQLGSAGVDPYIISGILAPKTILLSARGAYGKTVGEHMFAMALMMQKKLHLYRDDRSTGGWNDYGTVTSISDATVLIIGLGDIGLHFAGMAKALGAHVIGVKRRMSDCPEQVDELYLMEDLEKILPKADIILSVLPSTSSTQNIYSNAFFKSMKKSGIFLNAGRGTAVDQDALLLALKNKEILAAGVDVTEPEPLPGDHPLWREQNMFITPHVSGQYHLPETLDKIVEIAASNLKAYLSGKALKNTVDFNTGYCD